MTFCAHCGEEINYVLGVGWVEMAEGGHYDICPEDPANLADSAGPETGRHISKED